jgi:hypothetical protein
VLIITVPVELPLASCLDICLAAHMCVQHSQLPAERVQLRLNSPSGVNLWPCKVYIDLAHFSRQAPQSLATLRQQLHC